MLALRVISGKFLKEGFLSFMAEGGIENELPLLARENFDWPRDPLEMCFEIVCPGGGEGFYD